MHPDSTSSVDHWLRGRWRGYAVRFCCVVDLRNSGFKLAPVDTNLCPGGFNNLNPEFIPLCVEEMMAAVKKSPDIRSILLIPENHTCNILYLKTWRFCKPWCGMRERCSLGAQRDAITKPRRTVQGQIFYAEVCQSGIT